MEKSHYLIVYLLLEWAAKKLKHYNLETLVYHSSVNSRWMAVFYLCKAISMWIKKKVYNDLRQEKKKVADQIWPDSSPLYFHN